MLAAAVVVAASMPVDAARLSLTLGRDRDEALGCNYGQLVGGPQARVPLYVPYADFFQYQAGPGRLAKG